MADKGQLKAANKTIEAAISDADSIVTLSDRKGKKSTKALLGMLADADKKLAKRLRAENTRIGGGSLRFTGASIQSYRAQIKIVTRFVQLRLQGMTSRQAAHAIAVSMSETVALIEKLDKQFTGVARPLSLRQASVLNSAIATVKGSILASQTASIEAYGTRMIAQFERIIGVGLTQGATRDEMVAAMTGHAGSRGQKAVKATINADGTAMRIKKTRKPVGVFEGQRYQAERIVRTETANAYNAAKLESFRETRAQDMPDMQKKIVAVLDDRTAPDSIAVHGQIRELDEYFLDGAGRTYLRPPARPNDRETIIPWSPQWGETPASRQPNADTLQSAISKSVPKKNRVRGAATRANGRKRMAQVRAQQRRTQAQLRRQEDDTDQ